MSDLSIGKKRGFSWNLKIGTIYLVGLCVLAFLVVFGLSNGTAAISFSEIKDAFWDFFTGKGITSPASTIIFTIRLPRIIMALLVGMMLSMSGTVS